MTVRVVRSADDPHGVERVTLTSPHPASALGHDTEVGAGVRIGADLMSPNRWHTVSTTGRPAAKPVLRALLGHRAADGLDRLGPLDEISLEPDSETAGPWCRIAVVDALDRWLQLPLNQSLIDAERGVCRGRAARTLPPGEARDLVVGDGLRLARRASVGLAHYLRELVGASHPVPAGLGQAVKRLMAGYCELAEEVREPDRQLGVPLAAWRALSAGRRTVIREATSRHAAADPEVRSPGRPAGLRLTSMIDPRRTRARVFALADPDSAEITLSEATIGDEAAVRIRVPGFLGPPDPDIQRRLLVRLVDHRTADLVGQALLTTVDTEPGQPHGPSYQATVPVAGRTVDVLRADVFDALTDIPPVGADTGHALRDVRRAAMFLSEWRRLVALARLPSTTAAPARRILELAKRIQSGEQEARSGRPLFAGGPSVADLVRLADLGDERLLRCLRDDRERGRTGLVGLTGAAGELLVAELAAVHTTDAA